MIITGIESDWPDLLGEEEAQGLDDDLALGLVLLPFDRLEGLEIGDRYLDGDPCRRSVLLEADDDPGLPGA